MRAELDRGAVPFTCQGNENGLAIEGGETLGYEIVSALAGSAHRQADAARPRGGTLDHIVVQVGGGALTSACAQARREAVELGALPRPPRIHAVQTTSAHPLERELTCASQELSAPATRSPSCSPASSADGR